VKNHDSKYSIFNDNNQKEKKEQGGSNSSGNG
jgi:hypothetical protein